MHMLSRAMGKQYAGEYKEANPWTTKTGDSLNRAAFEWHTKGRSSSYDPKPEGWLSRDEMSSQISDLNKRYDALKINYDTLMTQRAPNVHASNVNWRDEHGGYGDQSTQVDNKAAAAATQPTKTASIAPTAPKQTQTYTGTATL